MKNSIITFIILFSIALWCGFIGRVTTNEYGGDLLGVKIQDTINISDMLFVLFLCQLSYIIAYVVYKFFLKINFSIKTGVTAVINIKRFSVIMFFILIFHVVFVLVTGVGKIGSTATNPLSPVFAATNPLGVFFLYYAVSRKYGGKLLFINLALFFLLQLSKGWTGFILLIFFIELAHQFSKRNFLEKNRKLVVVLLPVFIIFGGSYIYQYLYIVKNHIRGFEVTDISYSKALQLFTDRLTNYSVALGTFAEKDRIIEQSRSDDLLETKGFFRPISPTSLMPDKNFRTINNSVMLAYFPDYPLNSSVDVGIFMYSYFLLKSRPLDASFNFILTSIVLLFLIITIKILFKGHYSSNIVIFYIIFYILYTCSGEVIFSSQYLMLFFYIPILLLFNALEFRKKLIRDESYV
ncbi:oligosaccharide repeat unit polymerase [Xenorhabdus bovienii]|uniref:oligosaccharide repeat unit polymerase n=1 Tax=Xenorhabdus bovienii TaxID=40576 RepID=UPI00237CE7FA|nr:oligosaccharide repeat unit polymerase [Xenorhabdus bovienii]MDE1482437.1 oligosaccharide repeat unit polymerase [Xenorhabdus bovienii]MDE9458275.1 oligosaccharide repeat unit polymerase [Xenorhabdus bovienii]MDE9514341.1 oligosaccharide repeat unit polymerase [Xenorhabdus bovienii]